MQLVFFPGPVLGWVYLTVLLALLALASYTDLRALAIPKWITLTALGLGVLMNVVRGVWLGAAGGDVFLFEEPGAVLGGCDGLLFALTGFLLGFAVFFGLWVVGICGGGDVKLFAALGAWVGPGLLLWVFAVTLVLVAVLTFGRLAWRLFSGKGIQIQKFPQPSRKGGRPGRPAAAQPRHRALGFALPLALACVLVLPWAFRFDLRLAGAPGSAHAGAPNARP